MSDSHQPIIDSVPGFSSEPPAPGLQPGEAVPVDFRGDPSRVPGHPSNPTNQAAEAYAAQLAGSQPEQGEPPVTTPPQAQLGELAVELTPPTEPTEQH